MKHGTIKALGVTALGAAFAASGAGAASAADLGETVETTGRQLVSAPPVQDAMAGGDSVARMPTASDDVVASTLPADVAKAEGGEGTEGGEGGPGKMLGGLPLAGQLAGNSGPTETVTDTLGGGLPTDGLPLTSGSLGGGGLPLG
ncbi:ATP-binding protein [Streptomyces sp. RKND-216]|uniref:ATP-binding protein n=1 Tax=Streptomyces hazeniae TaxID=3075538 RepID=A0ABU2NVZ1_9ACTN|nr:MULTISPECIES: hypothetical protein [unclassified Streptomyces]MDT0380899.1 ATP-binding protein [Streptomyces sp. DSM 42041]THA24830.1 ATP-binding protein [Streptomyces sp. RKND-216]